MKRRGKTKFLHMLGAFVIMCTMINLFSFPCGAKTAFKKERPVGVMASAVNGRIVVSWEPLSAADGYEIYEARDQSPEERTGFWCVKQTGGCRVILEEKAAGTTYYYYVRAYQRAGSGKKTYSESSAIAATTVAAAGTSTIKNLLRTALAPVGSTMYIWGGGWNKADTGAGPGARRIGLSPEWRSFAGKQTSAYNYKNYRYKILKGLDCSGYVGWTVYNVLHTKSNQKGYVYSASEQAKKLAGLGFGSYRDAEGIKDYRAGDIMSSTCNCCGHVWIVVGACGDGSVVLLHASPTGVQMNGTVTPAGKKNSEAVKLATCYMQTYYKSWYEKFPRTDRGSSYLSHYGQMRWKTAGKGVVLSDPDGYQNMSAKEILADLFETAVEP